MLKIFKWYFAEKNKAKEKLKALASVCEEIELYSKTCDTLYSEIRRLEKFNLVPTILKDEVRTLKTFFGDTSRIRFTETLPNLLHLLKFFARTVEDDAKKLYKDAAYKECINLIDEKIGEIWVFKARFVSDTKDKQKN